MKCTLISLAVALACGQAAAGGVPTVDAVAGVKLGEQVKETRKVVEQATRQALEAKRMADSVSGKRGMQGLFRNYYIAKLLPPDLREVYRAAGSIASGTQYGVINGVEAVLNQEVFNGGTPEYNAYIRERERIAVATHRVLTQKAYDGQTMRIDNINKLIDAIGQTEDQKAIDELNTRLAGEIAIVQAESNKIALQGQAADVEMQTIKQHHREALMRGLDPNNLNLPRLVP